MTVLAPPLLMKIVTTLVSVQSNWPSDGTLYAGYPYRWTITMTVTPQSTSYAASQVPYFYNGLDVAVGQWISNELGGNALQIVSISAQNSTTVTCIVQDVNQYNTYNDSTGNGDGSPASHVNGFVFTLTSLNKPILSAVPSNILTSQWQTDIISRFAYTNAAADAANSIINAIVFG